MADVQHAALDYTENHVAHAYEYANTSQREGATGFVAADIGKLALQTDDKSLWMLTATTPTWAAAILTGTITVDTIDEDTPAAGVTIDGVVCKDSAVTASNGITSGSIAVTGNVVASGTFTDAGGIGGIVPSGGIIMWSGAISAIPTGWLLCDGTSSTPDLTDRFVIHADADAAGTNNVGDTGGASTHTHTGPSHTHTGGSHALTTAELAVHTHVITAKSIGAGGSVTSINSITTSGEGTQFVDSAVTAANAGSGSAHSHGATSAAGTGATGSTSNVPKYYALAYIMKS